MNAYRLLGEICRKYKPCLLCKYTYDLFAPRINFRMNELQTKLINYVHFRTSPRKKQRVRILNIEIMHLKYNSFVGFISRKKNTVEDYKTKCLSEEFQYQRDYFRYWIRMKIRVRIYGESVMQLY